jgi:hypothetical protein
MEENIEDWEEVSGHESDEDVEEDDGDNIIEEVLEEDDIEGDEYEYEEKFIPPPLVQEVKSEKLVKVKTG